MLKSCIVAISALPALAATALAADLPARSMPPVFVPPPIPVFSWTGFYAGINAGYAWRDNGGGQTIANDPITASQLTHGTVPGSFDVHSSGFTGGGQVGYNYQLSSKGFAGIGSGLVIGLEADAAYTDLRKTDAIFGAFKVENDYHSRLDYLGTVRGRLGVAFDRLLIFGTGGFAYGQTEISQSILPNLPPGFPLSPIWTGSRSRTQTGYVVGGGVEYAIPTASFLNVFNAGAVTLKAEYLHYDLGTTSVDLQAGPLYGPKGTYFTDRVRTSGDLVRAGLNYKFGFEPAPVVARY